MADQATIRRMVLLRVMCQTCGEKLSPETTVYVALMRGDAERGTPHTVCAECWDEVKQDTTREAKRHGANMRVLDGRVLFADEKPKPSPRRIEWRGDIYTVPEVAQLQEWVDDGVCETPDGEIVEPDAPDSWLVILGVM